MEQSPSQPAWIYKRDGRLVPFEADKISRSLFAATESLGQPNAFMARELTDGILHFLKAEVGPGIPTTEQVADLVVKVVRELGQPALAQVFADQAQQRTLTEPRRSKPEPVIDHAMRENPVFSILDLPSSIRDPRSLLWQAGRACLRDYALREVFTRDLIAAQADGLLTLNGLEAPLEMAAGVLEPLQALDKGVVEAVERARQLTGQVLAIDGPEFAVTPDFRATYARELEIGLRATGLRAVVNLHGSSAPDWAHDLAEGPLFSEPASWTAPAMLTEHAEALLDQWVRREDASIRLDWHLSEHDVTGETPSRLARLARLALEGASLAFVFDRPRRPVVLAEGLDRPHPGVLLVVGLHLPKLLEQPGLRVDPARFVQKLGSLARLALSAGVQKRDFLRRLSRHRPVLARGFLLDRARLVVVPVGLEAVVRELVGRGLCGGGPGLELARQVVQRLGEVLQQDGRGYRLDTCVDSAMELALGASSPDSGPAIENLAGLTSWDAKATLKQQLKAAGALHALAGGGTAILPLPSDRMLPAEEVVELLRYAWRQTEVVRLRFVRMGPVRRQLTAPWEEGP
jgi:hypothetical protein